MAKNNIKVFGVGGGGSNTVDFIAKSGVDGIETYAINTDAQALDNSSADHQIHIGEISTKGLGAGALPEVGRRAAEESRNKLEKEILGADIVFVAAGMGGGTGTGAAPYIASLAKNLGVLTIGVVTKPFIFEGPSRMKMALEGLKKMNDSTDVTIVIPNEKLVTNHKDKFIEDAFELPDGVLKTGILAIVDLLQNTSTYGSNVDLNEIKTLLSNKGLAVIGIGESNIENARGIENTANALLKAIRSDILEISLMGSKDFIVQISCDTDSFSLSEEEELIVLLEDELNSELNISTTINDDPSLTGNERRVTIIATGYENTNEVNKILEDNKRSHLNNLFGDL